MAVIQQEELVSIPIHNIHLSGNLIIPENAQGIVIFSHGSGSSRKSPRNKFVAEVLQESGLATLLVDLLTEEEDQIYEMRFDIDLLTSRLIEITQWVMRLPKTSALPIGLFGASTGAASALRAAEKLESVKAVVSRGGRPDLAMKVLPGMQAPTLLIVGSLDTQVIRLNQQAYERLSCTRKMEIVEGATHLFSEPGKLEMVAQLATAWFLKYLKLSAFI